MKSGTSTLATSVQTVSEAELGTCCCSNLELLIIFSKDNLSHPLCLVRALWESPVSTKPTDTVAYTQMELQVCRAGLKKRLLHLYVAACCLFTDVHKHVHFSRYSNSPSVCVCVCVCVHAHTTITQAEYQTHFRDEL